MIRFRVLAAACALGGCATQSVAPVAAPMAPMGDLPQLAVAVAAQLEDAASRDPARLALVELELRRISDALPAGMAIAAPTAPAFADPAPAPAAAAALETGPEPPPVAAAQPDNVYAPAPQLGGGRSLFSALTLGAYPNADTARAAWFSMNTAHGEALAGLDARIETVMREDGAAAFVLKAGPFGNAQEAEMLCARLRQAGAVCAPGDFTGDRL